MLKRLPNQCWRLHPSLRRSCPYNPTPFLLLLNKMSVSAQSKSRRHFDRHRQEQLSIAFPLRVWPERSRTTAVQRTFQHEVYRPKSRNVVARDRPLNEMGKPLRYARLRHLLAADREKLWLAGDDRDIGAVAFVAAATVRQFYQCH